MPRQSTPQPLPAPRAAEAPSTPATSVPVSPPALAQSHATPAVRNLLPDPAQATYPEPQVPLRIVPTPRGTLHRPPDALKSPLAARRLPRDTQSTLLPSCVS